MNFFGRKNHNEKFDVTFEEQLAEQQVAPGTQLHYDSRLIQRLREQATVLMDLVARSVRVAQASKFDDAASSLRSFRLLFNEHLLEKNLRLYTFLACCLKSDPTKLELIRDIRRESGEVSRLGMRFLAHYGELGIGEENKAGLLDELTRIADMLSSCFAREEHSLHAMYQPPQRYHGAAPIRPLAGAAPASPEACYA